MVANFGMQQPGKLWKQAVDPEVCRIAVWHSKGYNVYRHVATNYSKFGAGTPAIGAVLDEKEHEIIV